jgi:hypothetical protein
MLDSSGAVTAANPDKVLTSDQYAQASSGTTGDGDGVGNSQNFYDATGSFTSWGPSSFGNSGDGTFGSVGVDQQGNVFMSSGVWMDVWRFPAPIPTPRAQVAHTADVDVFKPYTYGTGNMPGPHGFYYSFGVAVGSAGGVTQLIQSSDLIRFWNMPAGGPSGLSNGQAVDGVIGAPNPSLPYFNPSGEFGRVKTDQTGHLWAQGPADDVLVFSLPLTNGETASVTLSSPLPLLGTSQPISFQEANGDIAVDPNAQFLWISDPPDSRVLRIRNPLTHPQVDIILGQPNAAGTMVDYPGGNPSQTNLNYPGGLALDHHGNLYVADHSLEVNGDGRLLRYNASEIGNTGTTAIFGLPASAVYGAGGLTNFTSAGCATGALNGGVCGPWGPAFNSDDSIMVVGSDAQHSNNFMVLVLDNPLTADDPVTYLNDYDPQAYSETFDAQDNLYVANHNRSRVLIYLHPFQTIPPTYSPTATPTPTCTPIESPTPVDTNTPTASPTLTLTPTITPTPLPVTSVCPPYPNPAKGNQISCCYTAEEPSPVRWDVFTMAFRKIDGHDEGMTSGGTLVWDLKDYSGAPVANGLYFLRVEIGGAQPLTKILKVLVTR